MPSSSSLRPTGTPVREVGPADVERVEADLRGRWANVAVIRADEVWFHKGIEYDGVVVERAAMTPAEVYLAVKAPTSWYSPDPTSCAAG